MTDEIIYSDLVQSHCLYDANLQNKLHEKRQTNDFDCICDRLGFRTFCSNSLMYCVM